MFIRQRLKLATLVITESMTPDFARCPGYTILKMADPRFNTGTSCIPSTREYVTNQVYVYIFMLEIDVDIKYSLIDIHNVSILFFFLYN